MKLYKLTNQNGNTQNETSLIPKPHTKSSRVIIQNYAQPMCITLIQTQTWHCC